MIRIPGRASLPQVGREVWLLSIASAFLAAAFQGMMQLLKALYVLRLGFGPEFVGVFFATGALGFSVCSLPGGILGGRVGPVRVMALGAVINVLGTALFPLAEYVPPAMRSEWLLLMQVVVSGGWALFVVNQVPALMAFTTPENRKSAYGLKESLVGLGMFLGALVGGMLPEAFGGLLDTSTSLPAPYRYAMWATALVGLVSLVPLARVGYVPGTTPRMARKRFSLPPLLPFAVLLTCGFLQNSATASSRAFYPAYLDTVFGLPTSLIGAITSTGMLLTIGAALFSARLSRARSAGYSMVVALVGLSGALLLMSLVDHWAAAAAGAIGVLGLTSLWAPAYQLRQMEIAAPEQRALVAGAGSMAMSLGFSAMSFSGGQVVATTGYSELFLLGALLALVAMILMWRTSRRRSPLFDVAVPAPVAGPLPAQQLGPGDLIRS